jgi:ribosome-associated protein
MTEEVKYMADIAVKGIQEKKGRSINIIDLEGMPGAITQAFVVCEGGSPSQVSAIAESVEETMRKELKEKPIRIGGTTNNIWVVMDYTDVMVPPNIAPLNFKVLENSEECLARFTSADGTSYSYGVENKILIDED